MEDEIDVNVYRLNKNGGILTFTTKQLKDRKNSSNVSIFENVLMESEGIHNFFHDELLTMAKEHKKGLENNRYLDFLIQFGFSDSLFELYPDDIPVIRIKDREVPRLADMKRFKNLDQFIILNAGLVELHPSVCSLEKLELLSLTNNKLKSLPREIGSLKNLEFMNLIGNYITDFPSEISYLDKSNGGKLHRLAVKEEEIGTENYLKLKRLLPQTEIN
jgi:Leucine-rich repeat (LRR) protein